MLPLLLSSSGVNGVGVDSSCMTVELCAYIARAQGFAYFGVEAGSCERQDQGGSLYFHIAASNVHIVYNNPHQPETHSFSITKHTVCFAGDDGNLATSQGQSSSCTSACAREPSEMCGEWVVVHWSGWPGAFEYTCVGGWVGWMDCDQDHLREISGG